MKLLLESHILVWLAAMSAKLAAQARPFVENTDNTLFSVQPAYGN
ncbi:hypothetical protein [Agrobacterium sp. Ap1]